VNVFLDGAYAFSLARLGQHGYPERAIQSAVERLEHYRLIDDSDFANFWVGQRQSFRPRGPRALRPSCARRASMRRPLRRPSSPPSSIKRNQHTGLAYARRGACERLTSGHSPLP
jgi:hypothetical protein